MADKKFKILIVDEQIKSVEFLKGHLEASGYEVLGLTSGKNLDATFKNETIDLVLLSLNLADADSLQICKNLKTSSQTCDLPVIFITSHREIEERISALEMGADDFITKPFNLDELKARIMVSLRLKASKEVLKERTHQMEEESLRDELTKLYNRRYIKERMYEETSRAKRFGHIISCVIFDVDQFKGVNDLYGHEAGDKILIEIAEAIKAHVRAVDIVGRYGGEEFVILLPQTDLDGALVVAEKLRSTIENKKIEFASGSSAKVTISVGVASNEKKETEDLLYYADLALEQAKTSGKNKVVAWKKE